jgi:hypothetical protein
MIPLHTRTDSFSGTDGHGHTDSQTYPLAVQADTDACLWRKAGVSNHGRW